MEVPRERAAVLVVRVWHEDPDDAGLRGRVTRSVDIAADQPLVTAVSTGDEVLELVSRWLLAFGAATRS